MTSLNIIRDEPLIDGYAEAARGKEEMVLDIANALGALSVEAADRYGGSFRLALPEERGIYVRFGERGDSGRLYVSGSYPTRLGNLYYISDRAKDDASIALKRGVPAIVKEIERRVYPGYLANLAKLIERKKVEDMAAELRDDVSEKLANALGKAPASSWNSSNSDRIFSVNPESSSMYGDFTVASGGRVEIKLRSVPSDLACKLAEVISVHLNRGF